MSTSKAVVSCEFTHEQLEQLDNIIEQYGSERTKLIPMLEKIQQALGCIPVSVQEVISEKTEIPETTIYGVVSFYSYFTMNPRARHRIQVCMGTACYVKGAQKIADKIENILGIVLGESTDDKRFTYENTRCFGACGLAPVMVVDGNVYGHVKPEDVESILEKYE